MSEATTSLRVKTIDHVTLIVKDLQQSRRFYVEGLGMLEVERPGFSFPGLWFQAGDTQIHLIEEHADSAKAGLEPPEDGKGSRTHHFAFQVDDAMAAAEHCRSLGMPIVAGPKQRPDGVVQVYVTDPDDHVVELCSFPER